MSIRGYLNPHQVDVQDEQRLSESELAELQVIIDLAPPRPWTPAGKPPRPFGLYYRMAGGSAVWTAGLDGSLRPEMVNFILAAGEAMPKLVSEVRTLRQENERLKTANAVANGKLSAALRAANKLEKESNDG